MYLDLSDFNFKQYLAKRGPYHFKLTVQTMLFADIC